MNSVQRLFNFGHPIPTKSTSESTRTNWLQRLLRTSSGRRTSLFCRCTTPSRSRPGKSLRKSTMQRHDALQERCIGVENWCAENGPRISNDVLSWQNIKSTPHPNVADAGKNMLSNFVTPSSTKRSSQNIKALEKSTAKSDTPRRV